MNTRLTAIIAFIIVSLVQGCSDPTATTTGTTTTATNNTTTTDTLAPSFWRPIPIDVAEKYILIYRNNFKPRIQASGSTVFKDRQTNHVWTDYHTLKQFLRSLEYQAKMAGNKEMSGIRYYFAAYPDEAGDHDEAHRKQLTLVMVGTWYDKEANLHRDLVDEKDISINTLIGGFENHGHLCPPDPDPYCRGAHFFEPQ